MDGHRFIPNFLSAGEVGSLAERLDALGWSPAAIRLDSGVKNDARIRDSDRVEFVDEELGAGLWERIRRRVSDAELQAMCGSPKPPAGLRSWFRGYRYAPGQRFAKHRDAWEASGGLVTKITALFYLSDAPDGDGSTTLHPNRGTGGASTRIAPAAGGLLLLAARILHEGEAPTRGKKIVLRSDVLFEPQAGAS